MNAAETIGKAIVVYKALVENDPDAWEAAIRKVELDWLRHELMLTTEVEGYVPFAYTVALARAILNDPEFPSWYWANTLKLTILDPDGWDRANFKESWAEPITRAEFMLRARRSTVDMKRFDELEAEVTP